MQRGQQNCKVAKNTVIPAKAGIKTEDVNPFSLDSRLRGKDKKNVSRETSL